MDYAIDDDENTELHLAVIQGNIQEAFRLIVMGADIHLTNANEMAPIHLAVKLGNPEMVEFLLNHGADKEHPGRDGYRPIHFVCLSPKPMECLAKLLDSRVDIHAVDSKLGDTALQLMVKWKYEAIDVIKLLLHLNCNVHSVDKLGNTLLHHMGRTSKYMQKEDVQEISKQIFRRKADPNVRNNALEPPLIEAVRNDCLFFASILFHNNANLMLDCGQGFTPLDFIIRTYQTTLLNDITVFLECLLRSNVIVCPQILHKLASYDFSRPYYIKLQNTIISHYPAYYT